jgi:hypothetical protein
MSVETGPDGIGVGLLREGGVDGIGPEFPLEVDVGLRDMEALLKIAENLNEALMLSGANGGAVKVADEAHAHGIGIRWNLMIADIRPASVWGSDLLIQPRRADLEMTIARGASGLGAVDDKMEIRLGSHCVGWEISTSCDTTVGKAGRTPRQVSRFIDDDILPGSLLQRDICGELSFDGLCGKCGCQGSGTGPAFEEEQDAGTEGEGADEGGEHGGDALLAHRFFPG